MAPKFEPGGGGVGFGRHLSERSARNFFMKIFQSKCVTFGGSSKFVRGGRDNGNRATSATEDNEMDVYLARCFGAVSAW